MNLRHYTTQILKTIIQNVQRRQPSILKLEMISFNDWKGENSEQGFKLPNDFAGLSTSWSQELQNIPFTVWTESNPNLSLIVQKKGLKVHIN